MPYTFSYTHFGMYIDYNIIFMLQGYGREELQSLEYLGAHFPALFFKLGSAHEDVYESMLGQLFFICSISKRIAQRGRLHIHSPEKVTCCLDSSSFSGERWCCRTSFK